MKKISITFAYFIFFVLSTLLSANGADIYKKCASCHGQKGEKKALGISAAIGGWKSEKTIHALNGYRSGKYGGPMKGLMRAQVSSLSDAQINEVAKYLEAQ